MPATTRGANKQTKLEDVGAGVASQGKTKLQPQSNKRKAADRGDGVNSRKKRRASSEQHDDPGDENGDSDQTITINRAPVLELWAASVTHFLYPSLSWSTCLSAGGAISTITAISKGRSIGKIEKPDPAEAEKKREERKKKAEQEHLEEVEVMSFKLSLSKDGRAMVSGKAKKDDEETLKKKYGEAQYHKAKRAFEDALQAWTGKEEELDRDAFKMYEVFRPSIPPGQSGWGRKGQLNLKNVKSAIEGRG